MAVGNRRFLFVLGSSRRGGNSEALARLAAAELDDSVEQQWLRLLDLDLPQFHDVRHEGDGIYPPPGEAGQLLLDATLAATDIVMVAPLYWYSLPARTQNYLDHWSGWMRVPNVDFLKRMAGKTMWAVSAVSDEDFTVADPLLGALRLSAKYCAMHWGGDLLGFGNRPEEVLNDARAVQAAAALFARDDVVTPLNRAG